MLTIHHHIIMAITARKKADGNMKISEKAYYEYLYKCLKSHELLPKTELEQSMTFRHCFDMLGISHDIIQKAYKEFGAYLEYVFFTNARKAVLVRDNYTDTASPVLERTAVYFSALGCLIDHMIDNGTEQQKKIAFSSLQLGNFSYYFENFSEKKTDSVLDELFEYVGQGLHFIKEINYPAYSEIIDLIHKAAASELFVSGEKSSSCSLTDKSVIFVIIDLKIMTADLNISDIKLFEHFALAIQLIDDICDVFEDVEEGHSNPVALLFESSDDVYTAVDKVVGELIMHINAINKEGSIALSNFVLYEIRGWSMSCSYIRKMVWKNS